MGANVCKFAQVGEFAEFASMQGRRCTVTHNQIRQKRRFATQVHNYTEIPVKACMQEQKRRFSSKEEATQWQRSNRAETQRLAAMYVNQHGHRSAEVQVRHNCYAAVTQWHSGNIMVLAGTEVCKVEELKRELCRQRNGLRKRGYSGRSSRIQCQQSAAVLQRFCRRNKRSPVCQRLDIAAGFVCIN